jgi:uncharacterized protein YegJ (DUF2314 family)
LNVSSWFRQKRQGIRPVPPNEVYIPLEPMPTTGLMVYFRPEGEVLSDPDDLFPLIEDWIVRHAGETLGSGIHAFCEQGMLSLEVHSRDDFPPPPDALLRAYGPGENEERRYRNATHLLLVSATDLLLPPRIGLWSVMAVARALAEAMPGGVLLDPEFPRLLGNESIEQDLPSDGMVRVLDHILIPYSQDKRTGLNWMTTRGMNRFGLPDLELRNVPPHLVQNLMPVLNGVAQRLTDTAVQVVMEANNNEPPPQLTLPAEFSFSLRDIQRAYDAEDDMEMEFEPFEGEELLPQGETIIRLEVTGGTAPDDPPLVRLAPPRGTRGGTGVWLNRLLTDLFGNTEEAALVETGNETMEEAHQQAVASLPLVRDRFQAGFRSGEVLHVKHGFPTEGTSHEYMWIAVTGWEEGRLKGYLASDPQYRRDLRAGQKIEIEESDVYDWLIRHTDGRMEGAFTNRALPEEED